MSSAVTEVLSPMSGNENNLNTIIKEFGEAIFKGIDRSKPSAFSKTFWSGRIMEWSMSQPEFKLNMFRLVDVLPSLRTSAQIAEHVNEYLGTLGSEIGALAEWGLNVDPHSIRAKITALAVRKSVEQMASQFIAGETPEDSLKPLKKIRQKGIAFTCDLLGEFSLSEKEGDVYVQRYIDALTTYGKEIPKWKESAALVAGHPGESSAVCMSVKLTALYSQCSILNGERSIAVLSEKLSKIVSKAKEVNALLYIDAEDMGSNDLIYAVYKRVFSDPSFKDFPFPGIVCQAYAKESGKLLQSLIDFAKERGNPIAVRLVKGAYWDYETIVCKQNNWPSPLFSKKESSDANYEKLSRVLLDNTRYILPAFGSHNIRSLSHACCYAKSKGLSPRDFELQMLFGMADQIGTAFQSQGYLVRQYVPLGSTLPGMGYLIRRLLENTSNESFLRHTFFDAKAIETLLAEPKMRD